MAVGQALGADHLSLDTMTPGLEHEEHAAFVETVAEELDGTGPL